MLRQYEAIYQGGALKWLRDEPRIEDGTRIRVTVEGPGPEAKQEEEVEEAMRDAWGCLGEGKTLDEIDREIAEMRDRDWERDWPPPQ